MAAMILTYINPYPVIEQALPWLNAGTSMDAPSMRPI